MESFFNKFVDYLVATLLKMESTLTTFVPVFLRATNLIFFAYKTNGFIHIADIDFIDRFSYFATEKLLIFGEDVKTI